MNSLFADFAVIGGGPAGLMAAETLAAAGARVHLFDAMPTVGRKFLLAGRGGLNLTHSEAAEPFASRFGERRAQVEPWLAALGPQQLCDWAHGLGIETFVGTSGRVFPKDMKAAPLLRAWLHRLRAAGVQFHMRHRWTGALDAAPGSGWAFRFATPAGESAVQARAVVLALGGGSWARLGSDGAWVPWLTGHGVDVAPLLPANCGFDVGWSSYFSERFAGQPFKSVAIEFRDSRGRSFARKKGEFVATASGVEGSLIYAASGLLRDEIAASGSAELSLDLLPDRSAQQVRAEVLHPRGSRSLASHLKGRLGLEGIKAALLFEVLGRDGMHDLERVALAIKGLPLKLKAPRPIDEAISSAGGVRLQALDAHLMVSAMPGVFCAGEMLDWEAPTGGYLLTASMASGVVAARGAGRWLQAAGG
ncbi:MAG: TIGR03862 family flavoprotein [Proteobacteria bacterium]|nr:TIGR03862 family flavoprotein [Pseudomonadota bacterium]